MAEEAKKRSRGQWFREMKGELKKIIWPSRQTVLKNTGTVLLCSLITGAVTGGISTLLVRRVPAAPFERKSL